MRLPLLIAVAAVILPTISSAQDAGQTPPAEPKCISENTTFKQNGKAAFAVVELQNGCEQRFRCKVNVYVVTAFGPKAGEKTLILAPKSKGAAARKSFVMKVRQAAGSIDQARRCTAI